MRVKYLVLLVALFLFVGCGGDLKKLRIATGTTVYDSGLLNALLPKFKVESGISVEVLAVGSGKAFQLARNGDVDAVLTHAPDEEKKFIAEGVGESRTELMYNYFLIAGPPDDPAGVVSASSATEAFERIYQAKAFFISRGDDSGTHQREKQIWALAHLSPYKEWWYVETGQGMGMTLGITFEKRHAYTLCDRGTFITYKNKGDLKALFSNDPLFLNIYSFIPVTKSSKLELARKLRDWLVSPEVEALMTAYRVGGESAFTPIRQLKR